MDDIDIFLERFFEESPPAGESNRSLRFLVAYKQALNFQGHIPPVNISSFSPYEEKIKRELWEEIETFKKEDVSFKHIDLDHVADRLHDAVEMIKEGNISPLWLKISRENKELFAVVVLADTLHRFPGISNQFQKIRDNMEREWEELACEKERGFSLSNERREEILEETVETFSEGFWSLIYIKSAVLHLQPEDEEDVKRVLSGAFKGNRLGDMVCCLSEKTIFYLLNELELISLKEKEYKDTLLVDSKLNQHESLSVPGYASRVMEGVQGTDQDKVFIKTEGGRSMVRVPQNLEDLVKQDEFNSVVCFVQVALSHFSNAGISWGQSRRITNWYAMREELTARVSFGGLRERDAVYELAETLRTSIVNIWKVNNPELHKATEEIAGVFFNEGKDSDPKTPKQTILYSRGKYLEQMVARAKVGLREQAKTYLSI